MQTLTHDNVKAENIDGPVPLIINMLNSKRLFSNGYY